MTGRERFRMALAHAEPDRIPYTDAPWQTTIERWQTEGMPADVPVKDFFGFEEQRFGTDVSLRLPVETLEETEEYTVVRDANGATKRTWRHATSVPEYVDFVVKTPEDWRKLPERSTTFDPDRVSDGIVATVNEYRKNGRATQKAGISSNKQQSGL